MADATWMRHVACRSIRYTQLMTGTEASTKLFITYNRARSIQNAQNGY